MHPKRFRWRIALPFSLLVIAMVAALTVYVSILLRRVYLDGLVARLEAEAALVGMQLRSDGALSANAGTLADIVQEQAAVLKARLTIIDGDGTVLADSQQEPGQMENHLYRPEVRQALEHGVGRATRFSNTLGYDMLYTAVSIRRSSSTIIIRLAVPMSEVQAEIARMRWNLVLAACAALLLVFGITYLVTQRTLRPIYRLQEAVDRMTAGDLDVHILSAERDEVGHLTNAFNQLAESLRLNQAAYARESDRLNGIVEHLPDGVVILDNDGLVRLANPAALRLLGFTGQKAEGTSLAMVSAYPQVVRLWRQFSSTNQEVRDIIELERAGIFCQVYLTGLAVGGEPAALLMLQDLTNLRRLETIRRDFISNISHELRTPLASLKLLAETLREGALDDPPTAQKYIARIETEVDGMTQMVEELLELSRIESGRVPLKVQAVEVAEIVTPVVQRLQPLAERAGVALCVELPSELPPLRVDPERVERALTNLVHNGIKFTRAGGFVRISADVVTDGVQIDIRDTGIGISPELLERVFERFFTADKSRSGGTGLGLAIARHIVQAHQGRLWAESTPGVGSIFHMILPVIESSANPQS